jgi:hypothetical protein
MADIIYILIVLGGIAIIILICMALVAFLCRFGIVQQCFAPIILNALITFLI